MNTVHMNHRQHMTTVTVSPCIIMVLNTNYKQDYSGTKYVHKLSNECCGTNHDVQYHYVQAHPGY